ncbi:Hypothetical predicted protein [Mytilus galloprovincialis]|uniref:Uncharacterized protein n=1 Tax=Mytilus galloprovincialis TaxID=29158 RepID=A0A8B6EX19_MYTGA|nr:Hypothetical predicted protein [Mytilus galloprovincialis]
MDALRIYDDISSLISDWLKQAGMEVLDGVKEGGKQLILKRLGLYEFFSGTTCDKERKPFTPNVGGWNNECPLGIFGMPELPDNMACRFKDTCTGIECCIEIPGLGLTLHPFLIIDPCGYTVNYGVNTINETIRLINYEWGKTEKINLAGGVIQLQMVIKKPHGMKKFIVYLSAKACFEERCVPDVKIFDGTEIPQPICDLYADYNFKEFSLSEWGGRVGADIKGQLKTEFRTLLLEQLGLDAKLKNPSCNRSDAMYSPAVNGWNNDCPALSPPALSGPVSCYIPDYCTGIDCCLDFDYLDLHLNFYLYVDTCNYVIKGGIEKFTFEYQLLDYKWGEVKEERLVEIIRIKYKIDRLEEQKKLIIDAELKICLEKEDCSIIIKLFDQQLVSQPLCDMEMGGQLLNLSFTDWVQKTGENIGNTLTSAVANKLLDELGLTKFMNSVPCDRYTGIYTDSENGWNSKDCPPAVNLPPIETSMTCYIPNYCTGINCCIEVDQIGKSFNVYALLDGCNQRLTLGIERRKIDISLIEYDWDFSLQKFSLDNNIVDNAAGLVLDRLLEELGIASELRDTQCSRSQSPYSPRDSNGWNIGCEKTLPFSLPAVPDTMSCYLSDTCTGIDCCIDVEQISRSINVYIKLDACNYKLTAGIEKLTFDVPLLNYEFGQKQSFRLMNIFRIDYTIIDLSMEKQFVVDMDVSLCFEANAPCVFTSEVMKNARLPKPICDLKSNLSFEVTSLKELSENLLLDVTQKLPSYAADILLERLGISQWMQAVPCSRQSSQYTPNVKGWKIVCPSDLPLQDLTGSLSCTIPDYCTGVDCCVEIPQIGRTFHVYLLLDACSHRLKIGIENLGLDQAYFNFEFDKVQQIRLSNLITLQYSVSDLEGKKKYLVNMNITVCLEPSGSCIFTWDILKNVYLPKLGCDWNISMSDFSPSKLLQDSGFTIADHLPDVILSQVLEKMGVIDYLLTPQCDLGDYTPSVNGWTNKCSAEVINMTLPNLLSSLACRIDDTCTKVDCCIRVDFLKRNIHLELDVDVCSRRISFAIEKLKQDLTVFDYNLDIGGKLKLLDFVSLDYSIDNTEDMNEFRVNLNVTIQLDDDTVLYKSVLMKDAALIRIPCEWNTGFNIKDFSLQSYISELSLPSKDQLTELMAAKLIEELGIGGLLQDTPCQRSSPVYSPSINGWKSVCIYSRVLGDTFGNFTCYTPNGASVVDYVAVSEEILENVLYFKVSRFIPTLSDCHCKLEWELSAKYCVPEENDIPIQLKNMTPNYIWTDCSAIKFQETLSSDTLQNYILEFNNSTIQFTQTSVDDASSKLSNIFLSAANLSLKRPLKKHTNKQKNKKWFDASLQQARTNLLNYGKIYSRFPYDPIIKNHFYKLNREYSKLRKYKYKQYKQSLISQLDSLHEENPKLYWNLINELQEKNETKKKCGVQPSTLISQFPKVVTTER